MPQAVLNTNIRPGSWLVVVGAGGGLGHLAGTTIPMIPVASV